MNYIVLLITTSISLAKGKRDECGKELENKGTTILMNFYFWDQFLNSSLDNNETIAHTIYLKLGIFKNIIQFKYLIIFYFSHFYWMISFHQISMIPMMPSLPQHPTARTNHIPCPNPTNTPQLGWWAHPHYHTPFHAPQHLIRSHWQLRCATTFPYINI